MGAGRRAWCGFVQRLKRPPRATPALPWQKTKSYAPPNYLSARGWLKTFKRDYVGRMDRSDTLTVMRQLSTTFEHCNDVHPHGALKTLSPRMFRRCNAQLGVTECLEKWGQHQEQGGDHGVALDVPMLRHALNRYAAPGTSAIAQQAAARSRTNNRALEFDVSAGPYGLRDDSWQTLSAVDALRRRIAFSPLAPGSSTSRACGASGLERESP